MLVRSQHDAQHQLVAVLEQQAHDIKSKIERIYVAIEEGATGMVPRVKAYEADLAKIERDLKQKQQELAAIDAQRGAHIEEAGLLRVMMGKLSRKGSDLELRAIREQLSNMIAATVERVTLHPVGRGKHGDPSMDITFKSGMVREHTPQYVPF